MTAKARPSPLKPSSEAPPAMDGPRAQVELDIDELKTELRALRSSKLFWAGLVAKVLAAMLFGSHFATKWFAPFLYAFVHGKFAEPWTPFFERGETLAFPYGPGMLGLLSVSWLPALVTSFDPSSHLGLFLLRVPLLLADLAVLLFLMRWLRVHAHDALVAYWLSPIVFYATYVHGQLDLLPTALLCASLLFAIQAKARRGRLGVRHLARDGGAPRHRRAVRGRVPPPAANVIILLTFQNLGCYIDTHVMPICIIIALDIFIIIRFSINCSTVICSTIVLFSFMREASSETYGPRVYFPYHIFRSINQKYQKYFAAIYLL